MLQTKRIVIADDDADDCLLFKDALEELNVRKDIVFKTNGRELLDYLLETHHPPEFVFLDMNMPLMDGMESLAEIRKCTRLQNVPIIVFSTSSHHKTVMEAYHAEARENEENTQRCS